MRLTIATIREILDKKKYAKAKRIAVENFLSSIPSHLNAVQCYGNLEQDARSYGWNVPTIRAIQEGIDLHFSPQDY